MLTTYRRKWLFHCTISSFRVQAKKKMESLSAKSKQWHCMAYCCEKYVSLFKIEEPFHPTSHFPLHSFQESSLKMTCHQTRWSSWKQHKVSSTGTSVQTEQSDWYLGHWSFTDCSGQAPFHWFAFSFLPSAQQWRRYPDTANLFRHGPSRFTVQFVNPKLHVILTRWQ